MICINDKPLEGNEIAPPVKIGEEYTVETIYACLCGQEHYDVGLKSKHNYIRCHNCKREIPKGDIIHWCHPSRFENKAL